MGMEWRHLRPTRFPKQSAVAAGFSELGSAAASGPFLVRLPSFSSTHPYSGTCQNTTNVSVQEALAAWPDVAALTSHLGSPAMAGNPVTGKWLPEFMKAKPKVSFVAVHWYKGDNAKGFIKDMERVHLAYGLPVWVTEFAVQTHARLQHRLGGQECGNEKGCCGHGTAPWRTVNLAGVRQGFKMWASALASVPWPFTADSSVF